MSYDSKHLRCYHEMVSHTIVQKKLKEKVTYYRQAHTRVSKDEREREREREREKRRKDKDGKRERERCFNETRNSCMMRYNHSVWPASKNEG